MILGMSTSTFTAVHVVLSLIGIVAGIVVLVGMLRASRPDGGTALSRRDQVPPDGHEAGVILDR